MGKIKKQSFTLMELLVALCMAGVFVTMASRVIIQYLEVYEDIAAECYLTTFAQQLKARIERGYPDGGMREALQGSVEITESGGEFESLQYKTFRDLTSAHTLSKDDDSVTMTTSLRKVAEDYVVEYTRKVKDKDVVETMNPSRGKLTIMNVDASLVERVLDRTADTIWLYDDEKVVSITYDIQYARRDKTYNYRLKIDVPIINEN